MPNYRRDYSGKTWFFTVVTYHRVALFTAPEARAALRAAIVECRRQFPFRIDACVLLPDHLHAVWTLPEQDRDYSWRWSTIKRRFTQRLREGSDAATSHRAGRARRTPDPLWQPRFWAHRIDDEADFEYHADYVHINPLKHGLVRRVVDWPWSSFHRFVGQGVYPQDWGGVVSIPESVGRE